MSDVAREFNIILAEHGAAMVLKRTGETDLPLKGKRIQPPRGGETESVGGTAAQQHFRVKIGTAELAASGWASPEPTRKDTLILDGRTRQILDVAPLRDGDVVAVYVLEVAG